MRIMMKRALRIKLSPKQLNLYNYLADRMDMSKEDLFEYILSEWADLQKISMPNKMDTAKKFNKNMVKSGNDKLIKLSESNFDRIVSLFYVLKDISKHFKGSTVGK